MSCMVQLANNATATHVVVAERARSGEEDPDKLDVDAAARLQRERVQCQRLSDQGQELYGRPVGPKCNDHYLLN